MLCNGSCSTGFNLPQGPDGILFPRPRRGILCMNELHAAQKIYSKEKRRLTGSMISTGNEFA
jgi:hypothetical protein